MEYRTQYFTYLWRHSCLPLRIHHGLSCTKPSNCSVKSRYRKVLLDGNKELYASWKYKCWETEQEDFYRPEIPLEKMRKIDKEARIPKKAEMKRKFNRNQKCITPWDIQLSCLTSLLQHNTWYTRSFLLKCLSFQYKPGKRLPVQSQQL